MCHNVLYGLQDHPPSTGCIYAIIKDPWMYEGTDVYNLLKGCIYFHT